MHRMLQKNCIYNCFLGTVGYIIVVVLGEVHPLICTLMDTGLIGNHTISPNFIDK